MVGRLLSGITIAALMGALPLGAQIQRPLAPLPTSGLRVAPFFDGWYANPDGSVTLSFGYSNLNKDEVIDIPLGPSNFIEPKQFDGRQPTSFPPGQPDTTGGTPPGAVPGGPPDPASGTGRGASRPPERRPERERGVFTVTVPASFKGDVVWTLIHRGQTYRVPGRARSEAYHLSWPMAMGSVPPLLRFQPDGPTGRGPAGVQSEPMQASAGVPIMLTVLAKDDSVREKSPVPVRNNMKAPMNATWYKHSGPGAVEFNPPKAPIANIDDRSVTSATFKQPGEYVVRVRVDNYGLDSSPGNQCCWTNGYVKVTVR